MKQEKPKEMGWEWTTILFEINASEVLLYFFKSQEGKQNEEEKAVSLGKCKAKPQWYTHGNGSNQKDRQ